MNIQLYTHEALKFVLFGTCVWIILFAVYIFAVPNTTKERLCNIKTADCFDRLAVRR